MNSKDRWYYKYKVNKYENFNLFELDLRSFGQKDW